VRTLDGIEAGQLRPRPQPADGVSFAPKLTPEDARVRWDVPAIAVSRRVRACTPSPGAWTPLGDARLKLWPLADASPAPADGEPLAPGELRVTRGGVLAGTATRPVLLGDVQPPGKRRMTASEWARGLRLPVGAASSPSVVLG